MNVDWTIYVKAFRDPTLRDVEEQAAKIGATFWKEPLVLRKGRVRRYWLQRAGVSDPVLLQEVAAGVRPDWRGMLKVMEADWV